MATAIVGGEHGHPLDLGAGLTLRNPTSPERLKIAGHARVGESAKTETAEASAEFEGLEDLAPDSAEKNSGMAGVPMAASGAGPRISWSSTRLAELTR